MTNQLRLDGSAQARGANQTTPIECMGLTFDSEDARREHFLGLLAKKLEDPAYRSQPGFPIGDDEDILRLSDPPYYTACPNPFLAEYVRVYGSSHVPDVPYHRDPFAVDVSVGKTDALYKAHGYHTKVPHLAIVPSILHYTEPGDIVLDGFCGSGMTGVAAQFCGTAPVEYRMAIEAEWASRGLGTPKWGARHAILGDLSPAATAIAAGYNVSFDVNAFEHEARRILHEVEAELSWMYETLHSDGKTHGRIVTTVWSEVFSCRECGEEIVFYDAAFDVESGKVADAVSCTRCGAVNNKRSLDRVFEIHLDPITQTTVSQQKRVPVLVIYRANGQRYERRPTDADLETIERASLGRPNSWVPTNEFPFDCMWEAPRLRERGIRAVHQMYTPRTLRYLSAMWDSIQQVSAAPLRHALQYWFDSHLSNLSLQNRHRPGVSFPYNPLSGVLYLGALVAEPDPLTAYSNKIERIEAAFPQVTTRPNCILTTGDSSVLAVPDDSVDYVFVDPPFGDNFPYWELNFVTESWYRVLTRFQREASVDRGKADKSCQKDLHDYQDLMGSCFDEYFRVLKPGRWMTVVFSNSKNGVWRAIQEAMAGAGFVVADVRTLDKQMGSFKQVANNAVKQDLVISAYKPHAALLEVSEIGRAGSGAAWAFVSEHLGNVPIFMDAGASLQTVMERTPQMLHDRMIGFFVQRELAVPLSTAEFMSGIAQRYAERDGMYFLPDQVAEYDKRRARAESIQQLSLMVNDESSAIQWLRQQLDSRPQAFSELQPTFMREAQQSWAKHEQQIELRELLEENFLIYDGKGPVPSQIKSYLSTNWREYRNLDADDAALRAKARDRWYVPDPGKTADLEKLRERQLLKEFDDYRASAVRRLKLFRTEAIRAGFKRAYEDRDWETIVSVAGRLPDTVVQEDEKLLMYYDVARMRVG